MKIAYDSVSDYTGIFTFDPILENMANYEGATGHNASIVHTHLDWSFDGLLTDFATQNPIMGMSVSEMATLLAHQNSVLAISWDPLSIDFLDQAAFYTDGAGAIGLQSILDGDHDAFIRQVAQQTRALDIPLMMNLFGEADSNSIFGYGENGDTSQFQVEDTTGTYGDPTQLDGPERVRDVFKHVIDIFNEEGVENVTWFMYTSSGLGVSEDSISPDLFYPGDAYIDWVGTSLYLDDASQLNETLQPGIDAWAGISGNPFIIPEMGIVNSSGSEVGALLNGLQGYDEVGAYVWSDFDGLTEAWGIPRLGDNGEWAALSAVPGIAPEVLLDTGEDFVTYSDFVTFDRPLNHFVGTGASDMLSGTEGADTLEGMAGDDIYIVDNGDDLVIEVEGSGYEVVLGSVSHTLTQNVEMLILDGISDLSGAGNALDNYVIGNAGINVLEGNGGDDYLDGGGGGDMLIGGTGNDIYEISDPADRVVEYAGEGQDTVISTYSLTLPEHVETLVLSGTGAINGTGTNGNDMIIGNEAANRLEGHQGDDTLVGNGGNDVLIGGGLNDVLEGGDGRDTLNGGNGDDILIGGAGDDRFVISLGADYAEGGAGADRFVLRAVGDMAIVADFSPEEDLLDLQYFSIASRDEFDAACFELESGLFFAFGEDQFFIEGVSLADLGTDNLLI